MISFIHESWKKNASWILYISLNGFLDFPPTPKNCVCFGLVGFMAMSQTQPLPKESVPWYKREVFRVLREESSGYDQERTKIVGYLILFLVWSFCFSSLCFIFFSLWEWGTGYYCFVIPATIPATIVFIFLNWFCLKFFRHNN